MKCLLFWGGLLITGMSVLGYYVLFDWYMDVMAFWQVVVCLVVFACSTTVGISFVAESLPCTCTKPSKKPSPD